MKRILGLKSLWITAWLLLLAADAHNAASPSLESVLLGIVAALVGAGIVATARMHTEVHGLSISIQHLQKTIIEHKDTTKDALKERDEKFEELRRHVSTLTQHTPRQGPPAMSASEREW